MAYQVVNAGMCHWFAASGDAVIGYVCVHRVYLVAGAPVCPADRLSDVLDEWHAFVADRGGRVCYFGAADRLFDVLHGRATVSTVLLGEQPVWDPQHWPEIPATIPSVRRQLLRARNKGVRVREWAPARASADPRLQRCLDEWLATRRFPTLHFLVEPQTLHDLTGRRVFVAERGDAVVGFLNASPIPARRGWLVEQFVRGREAPNGTIELLLDTMMHAVAADGARQVTLGLAPLRESSGARVGPPPVWLRALLAFVRAHGRRFYNFQGLEQFKAKFRPHTWEPIYAISFEPQFSPRTAYAIAAAFTQQSPLLALARGLRRAAATEIARIIQTPRRDHHQAVT